MKKYCFQMVTVLLLMAGFMFGGFTSRVMAAQRMTYDVSKGNVVIDKSGSYNLTGTTDSYCVVIKSGVKVNLWVTDLNVTGVTGDNDGTFVIESKASVNLIVKGTNKIVNGYTDLEYNLSDALMSHAISLDKGAKLMISKYSTGTLDLYGGWAGSGIGGCGSLYVLGGTIHAYGGNNGAGIGNALEPENFSVSISGGMVTASAGNQTTHVWSYIFDWAHKRLDAADVNDISAGTFVITGGHLLISDSYKEPVNALGKRLYCYIFNCKKGKVAKITVNGKAYGSTGMVSEGYLSLWSMDYSTPEFVITYANKKSSEVEASRDYNTEQLSINLYSEDLMNGRTFDLSKGSIEFIGNGCIYLNHVYKMEKEKNEAITLTGKADEHQVIVNNDINLIFDSVTADHTKSGEPVLIVGNNVCLNMILKGNSVFQTEAENTMIELNYHAELNIGSDKEENSLEFVMNGNGYGLSTENGTIKQYGGTIKITTQKKAWGIDLGERGSYELFGGRLEGISEEKNSATYEIFGGINSNVMVHGGAMTVNQIGFREWDAADCRDYSKFVMTGGEVTVTGRMIFSEFDIYGGNLKAHILGSGTGSYLYQYGGSLIMDRFITYGFYYGMEYPQFYGGTVEETGNVTEEEMSHILIGFY